MSVNDNSERSSGGERRPENRNEAPSQARPDARPDTRADSRADSRAETAAEGRGEERGGAAQETRPRTELEGEKLPDPQEGGRTDDGGVAGVLDAEGAAAPQTPAGEVAALREEVAALKDQNLRTMAELENARKRHAKEREDAVKYAASRFAKDMLDVADNLRRAIDAAQQGQRREDLSEPVRNLIEGVEATERTLLQAFERHGIQPIEAMGEKFNPNLHEAMFELDDASQPAGTVVQVLAPGYTIADRLLRPAQVGVSRGGQAQPRVDTTA